MQGIKVIKKYIYKHLNVIHLNQTASTLIKKLPTVRRPKLNFQSVQSVPASH